MDIKYPNLMSGFDVPYHYCMDIIYTYLINQSINQSVNFYSGLSDRSHFEDH